MKSEKRNGAGIRCLMVHALILMGSLSAASAQGPEDNLSAYLQLAASDIRARTTVMISGVMNFSAAEGDAFWPVYKKYEFEHGNISDQMMAVIKDYKASLQTLDDAKAKMLAENVFKLDEQKVRLSKKYYKEFSKVIGAKRATQLLQLLRRVDLLVDLKTAAMLPMIGEDW
jgi:hypothetical protein